MTPRSCSWLLSLGLIPCACLAGEIDMDKSEGRASTVETVGVDLIAGQYPDPPPDNTFTRPANDFDDLPGGLGRWYLYPFQLPEEYSNLTFQISLGVNDEFAIFINDQPVAMQADTSAVNFNDPLPGFVMFEDGAAFDNSGGKLNEVRENMGPVFQPGANTLKIYATDTVADGSFFSFDADLSFDNPFRPNAGINDAWYNPRTSGSGFFFIYYPIIDQIFAAWFTYDVDRPPDGVPATVGGAGHRWVTMQGPGPDESDTTTLTVYVTSGSVFDRDLPDPETVPVGTAEVFWHGCGHAHIRYEFPGIDEDDDIPLRRIVGDNIVLCEMLAEQQ